MEKDTNVHARSLKNYKSKPSLGERPNRETPNRETKHTLRSMLGASYDDTCERALLENIMFSLYQYGNSPENPMYKLVNEHFNHLARKHPGVLLRLTLPTKSGAVTVGILPCDFVDGTLSDTQLALITWKVQQCNRYTSQQL